MYVSLQLQFNGSNEGFGYQHRVCQLRSMDEMFPSPGIGNKPLEFFLMDVILNRRIMPTHDKNVAEPDRDSVVMVQVYGAGRRRCGNHWLPFSPVPESLLCT
jgi:hypothetical protein